MPTWRLFCVVDEMSEVIAFSIPFASGCDVLRKGQAVSTFVSGTDQQFSVSLASRGRKLAIGQHYDKRTFTKHTVIKPNTMRRRKTTTMEMKPNQVVIAGGTGFIGSRLAQTFLDSGTSVTILTRASSSQSVPRGAKIVTWDPTPSSDSSSGGSEVDTNPKWYDALRGADAVVNLCGKAIITRWTPSERDALIRSRLDSTMSLVRCINSLSWSERPRVLVNTSAVGYYGFAMPYNATVDESSERGDDFLAKLCEEWEAAANEVAPSGTRMVILRLGIVLGPDGGALGKMIPAYQLFVGGPLGSGRQWVPWVHIDDVVGVFQKAVEDEDMSGVYNCTAPNVTTMGEMCNSLARALKRPNLFAVPDFIIKLALGDASCVLLEGQKAVPKRLSETDYSFKFRYIDDAMQAVAREV